MGSSTPLFDALYSSPDALSRDLIFLLLGGIALGLAGLTAFLKRKK